MEGTAQYAEAREGEMTVEKGVWKHTGERLNYTSLGGGRHILLNQKLFILQRESNAQSKIAAAAFTWTTCAITIAVPQLLHELRRLQFLIQRL